MFRTGANAVATIEIEYGISWQITGCDFEGGASLAVSALGIMNLVFENNWIEGIEGEGVIYCDVARGNNGSGTMLTCQNNLFDIRTVTGWLLYMGNASICFGFVRNTIVVLQENTLFQGNILPGYDNRIRSARLNSVVASPAASTGKVTTESNPIAGDKNTNLLPIGKNGVNIANFTVVGVGGPTIQSVPSGLGLPNNVLQMTPMSNGGVFYYSIPSKLLDYLKGKTVSFSALCYGNGLSGNATPRAAVWESEANPSYSNATVLSTYINPAATALKTLNLTIDIPSGATSLDIGFRIGGTPPSSSAIILEAFELYEGKHYDKTMISMV
jgi:hypothetical protein